VFTSFVSKRPAIYINHGGRLYTGYDDYGLGSCNRLYLSNGYSRTSPGQMPGSGQPSSFWNADENESVASSRTEFRFLTFGGIDFYQFGHELDTDDLEDGNQSFYDAFSMAGGDLFADNDVQYTYWYPTNLPAGDNGNSGLDAYGLYQSHLLYKEPIQLHFIINDEPNMPKIFDNIDIGFKGNTYLGNNYLYFRKFAFWGSANVHAIHEFDMSEYQIFEGLGESFFDNPIQQPYSGAKDGFNVDSGKRMWYNVKEGTHHIPMRASGYGQPIPTQVAQHAIEKTCRGNYAYVAMTMGWDEGNKFFGETVNQFKTRSGGPTTGNLKDEGFNILSIVPYYRYSRR
jgi:hypothetical protein